MSRDLSDLRQEYDYEGLDEASVDPDPLVQFDVWFKAAEDAGMELANAMVLATVSDSGTPAARYVLLKEYSHDGFVFYTHADSVKGRHLREHPQAALLFYWGPMHRQVRIEGPVEMLPATKADEYFKTRPRGSQLSAWAAVQSSVVENRAELEARVREIAEKTGAGAVPRPQSWLGYRVVPQSMEFWQGRENRLHDRLLFTREPEGGWRLQRLAP